MKPQPGKLRLHVPPLSLCTDNAVMGAVAVERLSRGLTESLESGRLSRLDSAVTRSS